MSRALRRGRIYHTILTLIITTVIWLAMLTVTVCACLLLFGILWGTGQLLAS